MAYQWQNPNTGIRYLYAKVNGKIKVVKSLGREMSETDARKEAARWEIDHEDNRNLNPADKSMQAIWEEFIRWLKDNGRSWRTIKDYEDHVYPFVKSLSQLKELTPDVIKSWDQMLQNWTCKNSKQVVPLSTETRAHRLRGISAFCGWLARKDIGYLSESPFKITIPAQRKDAGRAIDGVLVKKLFENWPTGEFRGRQYFAELSKLFFRIKFYAGTRTSELLGEYNPITETEHPGITYECLNREKLFFTLGKTKEGAPRHIALPKKIMDIIPNGSGPIFYGKISDTALRKYLRRACKAAGIVGKFRPHDSRVSCASEWGRKQLPIKSMMDQFGWSTEVMALHYTKVATQERVKHVQDIFE